SIGGSSRFRRDRQSHSSSGRVYQVSNDRFSNISTTTWLILSSAVPVVPGAIQPRGYCQSFWPKKYAPTPSPPTAAPPSNRVRLFIPPAPRKVAPRLPEQP